MALMLIVGLWGCSPSTSSEQSESATTTKPADLTAQAVKVSEPVSVNRMEALASQYKPVTIPRDYGLNQALAFEDWKNRKIGKENLDLITGDGRINLEDGEEAFACHSFEVSELVTALITYIAGDTREQYILHTHDETGTFIAQLPIWMVGEGLDHGYASEILAGHKVVRGKMVDVDGGGQDAELEETFQINNDGNIKKLK